MIPASSAQQDCRSLWVLPACAMVGKCTPAESPGERGVYLMHFPYLRNLNPRPPICQCLKTSALYILANFIIVYREEQLQYQLLHQGLKQKSPLIVEKAKSA